MAKELNADKKDKRDTKAFTDKECTAGFRRLGDGFLPGFIGDPCHRGTKYYGSSPEWNPDGSRILKDADDAEEKEEKAY